MKKNKIIYKVWIEVEAYNETTGDSEDIDLPFASLASFRTEEDAIRFARNVQETYQEVGA